MCGFLWCVCVCARAWSAADALRQRMFAEGRTECVRPLSLESLAFCQRMEDANSGVDEKRRALRAAVAMHSGRAREATVGQGVDRHLFGLLVISIRKQMKSAQATLVRARARV